MYIYIKIYPCIYLYKHIYNYIINNKVFKTIIKGNVYILSITFLTNSIVCNR